MEKKLKTLDEHNKIMNDLYFKEKDNHNGIACPKCGEEMIDTNPNVTLTSCPPKKNVGCEKCGYTGYRIY
jgi:predicted RNA-binding Zn-ribbon protein involved in translation (DUF1610 family)